MPRNPKQPHDNTRRFLRRPAVEQVTGLKRSQIYRLMNRGEFPQAVRLSQQCVAWLEHEVIAWMDERIHARNTA